MKNLILLIFFSLSILSSNPKPDDYLKSCLGLSALVYSQFFFSPLPSLSRERKVEHVNQFDIKVRKSLKWNSNNLGSASSMSDFLLYGLTLGSIPIIPFFSEDNYYENLITRVNILSLNGLITNLVKITSNRERPKYRFNSIKEKSNETYKSFFSGHTSTAFSIGISNAIILSKQFPKHSTKIWFASTSIAAAAGYLRIASDEHYASDIIAGSIVGSIVGLFLHKSNKNQNFNFSPSLNTIHLSIHINK